MTVRPFNEEHKGEILTPKGTLKAHFSANEVVTNEHNPLQTGTRPKTKGHTPKQHLERMDKKDMLANSKDMQIYR